MYSSQMGKTPVKATISDIRAFKAGACSREYGFLGFDNMPWSCQTQRKEISLKNLINLITLSQNLTNLTL